MTKVLLVGGTGHLGRQIAAELQKRDYNFTAVVRNKSRKKVLDKSANNFIVADVTKEDDIKGICRGFDIVISALGKSVSPNDKSKPSFREIDFACNSRLLKDATAHSVKKFVYISAFSAENYLHLEYFKVHHDFSEKLKASDIDYSIIKPPAIFSSFIDLFDMAIKGRLITMGKGDKLTNPIDERNLAIICVDAIQKENATIEAGGKTVYSRKQINHIIQQAFAPAKKVYSVPLPVIKLFLPITRIASKNMYDKMAFFLEVMQRDTIAPQIGNTTLEEYIDNYRRNVNQ